MREFRTLDAYFIQSSANEQGRPGSAAKISQSGEIHAITLPSPIEEWSAGTA